MVIKALLQDSIKGNGKYHKTSVFPCSIFQLGEGINRKPGDPNYDLFQLALKSTAKRLYPNYCNLNVKMQQDWVQYDRKNKQEYIDSLSKEDTQILIKKLKENPELKNILMLDVIGEKIVIKQEQIPIELMSTMGCRTQNGADINAIDSFKKNVNNIIHNLPLYDNFCSAAQKDGRGNICPVTIILPTLAMQAKQIKQQNEDLIEVFMNLLDKKIHEAKDMLIERYEWICSQSPESAKFMYENNTMAGFDGKTVRSAMCHGTLAVGQLGLAEALQILVGCDHTEPKGMLLAKHIEQLFKDRCAEFKQQYKLNFGVYYSPAESLCYTALKKFREKYGIIPKVSDRDYFTNSIHCPVWHSLTPFEKIDIESELTSYSSAGCITYVELDCGMENNIAGLQELVNYAMDKDIPYFAINVPSDLCLDCGYQGEINDACPECGGRNIEQLRRVTGY